MNYLIFWLVIFLVVEAIGLFVYFQSIGFEISEYELTTDKYLDKDLTVCVLSDMHNADTGNNNSELLKAIDDISPNFIILAGDIFTKLKKKYVEQSIAEDFLRRLSLKYTVYYGVGNHEHYNLHPENDEQYLVDFSEKFRCFIKDNSISFLENTNIDLDGSNCSIYGLDLSLEYYRRFKNYPMEDDYIATLLGKPVNSSYNILIAHNPEYFQKYEEWGADLVISGHVHGGIVRIPGIGGVISPQIKLFPKYDSGLFERKNSTMILSRGIGWHSIPVRIFNKAELVKITIKQNDRS